MINYQLSFLIAVLAVCYTYILTQPGQIFNGLYNRLYKLFKTDERKMLGKTEFWLFKILIHCNLCFSGQFALWIFLILNFKYYAFLEYKVFFYTLMLHVFFVAFTIFLSSIIKNLYTKYIEEK